MDDGERVDHRIEIRKNFNVLGTDLQAIKKKMEENLTLETKVIKVLGWLEDMAIACRLGHADEAVLYTSFGGVVVRYYQMFRLHIEECREDQKHRGVTPTIYGELEKLATAWKVGNSVQNGKKLDV